MDIFSHISCKNYNDVCLKRPKINKKEAGVGPYLKKKIIVPKSSWSMLLLMFLYPFTREHSLSKNKYHCMTKITGALIWLNQVY